MVVVRVSYTSMASTSRTGPDNHADTRSGQTFVSSLMSGYPGWTDDLTQLVLLYGCGHVLNDVGPMDRSPHRSEVLAVFKLVDDVTVDVSMTWRCFARPPRAEGETKDSCSSSQPSARLWKINIGWLSPADGSIDHVCLLRYPSNIIRDEDITHVCWKHKSVDYAYAGIRSLSHGANPRLTHAERMRWREEFRSNVNLSCSVMMNGQSSVVGYSHRCIQLYTPYVGNYEPQCNEMPYRLYSVGMDSVTIDIDTNALSRVTCPFVQALCGSLLRYRDAHVVSSTALGALRVIELYRSNQHPRQVNYRSVSLRTCALLQCTAKQRAFLHRTFFDTDAPAQRILYQADNMILFCMPRMCMEIHGSLPKKPRYCTDLRTDTVPKHTEWMLFPGTNIRGRIQHTCVHVPTE